MRSFVNKIETFFNISVRLNKLVVNNYNPLGIKSKKNALLFFKTDWYGLNGKKKIIPGTTQYEAQQQAIALNELGYIVTIVDRKVKVKFNKDFDLFVGHVVGGNGKYFSHYFNLMKINCIKIAISPGANPMLSYSNYKERIRYFNNRHKNLKGFDKLKMPRTAPLEIITKNNNLIKKCKGILVHSNKFAFESYKNLKISRYKIVSPIRKIKDIYPQYKKKFRYKKNFFFYSGGGALHKGLDIVIESFKKLPNLNLFVATLNDEFIFSEYYKIKNFNNIKFFKNIKSDSIEMKKITDKCAFVIGPSCSDGDPVSIAECMKFGLIPMVTKETDNNQKYSLLFNNFKLKTIKKLILYSQKLTKVKISNLSRGNIRMSRNNEPENHRSSFKKAIKHCIKK